MKNFLLFSIVLALSFIACKETTNIDADVKYIIRLKVANGVGGKIYYDYGGYNYTTGIKNLEKKPGEDVYLKAEPSSGWKFNKWTIISKKDTTYSSDPIQNFTASQNVSYIALFIDNSIVYNTLNIKISGNGNVKSSPEGIDSRSDCSYPFAKGTIVNLSATPDNNWDFIGWTGSVTSSNLQIPVSMDSAKTVTANFIDISKPRFLLTITKSGNGTAKSIPTGIDCGSVCSYQFEKDAIVTLKATPDNQYEFTRWEGDATGTSDRIDDITMTKDKNITAVFTKIPTYTLKINKQGVGNVISSPSGIDCGSDCEYSFKQNTIVNLTATPDAGYNFTKFSGDVGDNANSSIPVTMNSNKSINAIFTEKAPIFIEDFNVDPLSNGWSNVTQSDYSTTLWEVDNGYIYNNSSLYYSWGNSKTALIKKIDNEINFKSQDFTISYYCKNKGCTGNEEKYFKFFINLYASDMTEKNIVNYYLGDGSFAFFGINKTLFVPIEGKFTIKKIGDQISLHYNDGSPLITYTLSSSENKYVASYISFGFNRYQYDINSSANICKNFLIDWIKIIKLN